MITKNKKTASKRKGMAPLQSILLLSFGAMMIVGTHSMWNSGIRSGTVASLDELLHGTPRNTSSGQGAGGSGGSSPINNLPWTNSPGAPPLLSPGGNIPLAPEGLTPPEPESPELPFCPKAPEPEEPHGPETPETEPPIDYMQMAQDLIDGLKEMTPEEQAAAMDALQLLIDMGAIADPTGVLDGINTLISAARGDWLGVGTGLAGTFLPYIGDSAKVLKLGKYTDSVTNLIALAAKNPKLAKLVDGPLKATQKALAGVVDKIPDRFGKTKDKLKALQGKLDDHFAARVTAPIDFDGHILKAEIKANGKVVGGHSTASGQVKVIDGTATTPNANGVYKAKIEVADPNNPGSYLPKSNNDGWSTMFPDSWSPSRVKVEVDTAFKNKTVNGNKWTGTTPSGVTVQGYLQPKTTAYPIY